MQSNCNIITLEKLQISFAMMYGYLYDLQTTSISKTQSSNLKKKISTEWTQHNKPRQKYSFYVGMVSY